MNILQSAWNQVRRYPTEVVAAIKKVWSAFIAERGRCRAISDLEALPRSVLRDIGIRRGEVPVVVDNAMRDRCDRAVEDAEHRPGPATPSAHLKSPDSVSSTPRFTDRARENVEAHSV